jgi:hypothetical protein
MKLFPGDSGSGLVLKVDGLWKLIGIVSATVAKSAIVDNRNVKICDLDEYVVYTDVAKLYSWIDQVLLETIF